MPAFQVYFPFHLPAGTQFKGMTPGNAFTVGTLKLQFGLHESLGIYYFIIREFGDEDDAERFIRKLWSGFLRLTLNTNFQVETNSKPAPPHRHAGRTFLTPHSPAILRSDERPEFISISLTMTRSRDLAGDLSLLFGETDSEAPNRLAGDAKIQTALALHKAHFHAESARAQLLALVMALESILPQQDKHSSAQRFLDKWHNELTEARDASPTGSDEYHALESLRRDVLFRKEASIRSKVRSMVSTSLAQVANPRAADLARAAVDAYDSRSTLLHTGELSSDKLASAVSQAREVMVELLKAKLFNC